MPLEDRAPRPGFQWPKISRGSLRQETGAAPPLRPGQGARQPSQSPRALLPLRQRPGKSGHPQAKRSRCGPHER
ncbi:conserved hypothetical protein [Citreicella sp. SE45]|nr:conserved hypothetical protein [Citreicella sp. SE45]